MFGTGAVYPTYLMTSYWQSSLFAESNFRTLQQPRGLMGEPFTGVDVELGVLWVEQVEIAFENWLFEF